MTRTELESYIADFYSTQGEEPWIRHPANRVFRHSGNKKWFALVMNLPRGKLGLSGQGDISVVNLKCDPVLIGAFREDQGIYPAYHMNKAHWLTVALDGTVADDKLKFLLDMSYELTK